MPDAQLGAVGGLQKVATTPLAGFTLQNATSNILTWTAPNDGNLHRVQFFITWDVTSAETGGAFGITWTAPDGTSGSVNLSAGGSGTGIHTPATPYVAIIKSGSTITLNQTSALTAGAAVLWAEMWGA